MLKFEKMTDEDLELVKGKMIADYAKIKIDIGVWSKEEALDLAKETFNTLLKKGVAANRNYFYLMYFEDRKVGYTWYALPETELFLYTVTVYENYLNKGYEQEAIKKIEKQAKELGARKITVHIFGNDKESIKKYEDIGYKVTDITVCKKI